MFNGALYNPLNTTQPMPGSYPVTSVKVQAYTNWEQGLDATAKTLTNGLYKGILACLSASDDPDTTLAAMAASPWGWYDPSSGQPNPIGKASSYQAYGSRSFPAGGGGFGALGGSAVGIALAVGAGALWAWIKGYL